MRKVKFLREFKFYLPGDTRRMFRKREGQEWEHDNIDLLQKWCDRKIIEFCDDVKEDTVVEAIPVPENKMLVIEPEAKEEVKPVKAINKKRRSFKKG